ncbi:2-oxoglutarate-dependent dioxygenase 19-like [Nymphaea colorata]|nr:2-oxoglutarate-dependent dioxygenase 19-like [Nymphaea colorata]
METVALCGGIKELSASIHGQQIPASYAFPPELRDSGVSNVVQATVPTIDLQLLRSHSDEERSEAIRSLGRACEEWGFFHLIKHGVSESLRQRMMAAGRQFFELPPPEKLKYTGKHVLDPIRYGTSFNSSVDQVLCWRDYLKVITHPVLNFPESPPELRSAVEEYSRLLREIAGELLGGISESLGLESPYIEREVQWDKGFQTVVINFYPRCPQPELALGIPPHSDHGLLTILAQSGVDGLQVKHDGHWVPVTPLPGSFLVNVGDHLEILTNGRYKSIEHRAMVNSDKERMSIAAAHGPCLDTVVSPAEQLLNQGGNPLQYGKMTYREYFEVQQSNQLRGKACLNIVKV